MQRSLPGGIERLIDQEGVKLPPEVSLTQTSMPVERGAPIAKDIAIGLNVTIDLTLDAQSLALLIGMVSASLATLILAVSRALKNRGYRPRVVKVDEVVTVTRDDGRLALELAAVRKFVEPGPQLKAELEARLGGGRGIAVDFDLET